MPVTLGARPGHDFDQPIGLLGDCHRRIEHFLGVLLRVCDVASTRDIAPGRDAASTADAASTGDEKATGPLSDPQREAIRTALEYFRAAAPRHTADEEQSLFPRLRASDDPRVKAAIAKMDALEADHRAADAAHDEVDRLARRWLDDGALKINDARRLSDLLHTLVALYSRHLRIEDNELFPLAAQVLGPLEIAQVGAEMAQRRGLSPRENVELKGPSHEGTRSNTPDRR
jgi:hemerythrin-like domain-containing protein